MQLFEGIQESLLYDIRWIKLGRMAMAELCPGYAAQISPKYSKRLLSIVDAATHRPRLQMTP